MKLTDLHVGAGQDGQPSAADPQFASMLARQTLALVLAGGRGTRLQELTRWRVKPALPFGGKFRIIDFPLSNCVNSGIRRIGVVTQYMAQSLIRHVQHGWSFLDGRLHEFVELLPAQQRVRESWYLGTADSVYQNIDLFRLHAPRYVLVLAGDHVYKMDYTKFLLDHVAQQADLTVACTDVPLSEASGFGVMTVDDSGRITAFQEKPAQPAAMPGRPDRALASMGIYIFNADFLYEQLIRDADDANSTHDFGKDLIPYLVPRARVFAHEFSKSYVRSSSPMPYWRDVGTLDSYWEANLELTRVSPELNLYDEQWPVWTYQPQLPPAKFVFDDDDRRGAAVDSMVAGGCIVSGSTVRRSLLCSRVRVHSYCTIEDAVLLPGAVVNRHAVLRRCIVDKDCVIPDGLQIGVDAAADRERFRVTELGIALVTPEMLGQRVHYAR